MKYAAFLCALLFGIGLAAAQNIGPKNAGPGGGIAPGQGGGGGSGTVNTGTTNAIAVYPSSGTTVAPVATANSAVLVTDGSGNPSLSTTLPNGIALGTPASGTLTNATGLPIGGITGLGTGVGTSLAAAVTGSGGQVLATSPTITSPTLVTPALGTPASGTLTNATGLPVAGITGLGTGVATSMAAAVTGSGGSVLATSPTIATPTMTGTTTTAGITDSGGVNTTATSGYSIGGNSVMFLVTPANANPVLAIGPGACAAMTSGANFNMCIGPGSLATYTGSSSAELVMIGPKAGAVLVSPAVHDVGVGTYVMHYETTGNSDTAMGGDAMRNSIGVSSSTAYGSFAEGNYYGQLSTHVGANAMVGNSASITVSGTLTATDVISLTFTAASIAGGATTITYTVGGSPTVSTIANGIAAAMTASTPLVNADIRSQTDGIAAPGTVGVAAPGTTLIGLALTVTNTSSGITETITITNGITAATTRNVGVGYDAQYGSRWVSASNDVCVGAFCQANLTTGNQNVDMGDSAGMLGTTRTQSVAIGDESFMNATTQSANTGVGWRTGLGCTTCRNTTLLGKGAGTSTLTTGNDIIMISDGSACDTNTANQLLVCGSGGTFMNTTLTNNAVTLTKMTGPTQITGTTFTITGCSATTPTGGATRGSYLSGTTGSCPVVITMGGATGISGVTTGWACYGQDVTTPADVVTQTASNTTTATLGGTTVSGDKIVFSCEPY